MTEFFAYEDLTWPEVAELPREVPLIVPLGSGYDRGELARQLGNPPRVGVLPPIPFGWKASGLAVPKIMLGRYAGNLVTTLREDGFTRAFALTPPGEDGRPYFALPAAEMHLALPNAEGDKEPIPPD